MDRPEKGKQRRLWQEVNNSGQQSPKNLKIVILAILFGLEVSYAIEEVNKRYKLRGFPRIENQAKLKSIYNFLSKFEAE